MFSLIVLILCLYMFGFLRGDSTCDIYLAPSLIPGVGRGVIAGRNYSKQERFDTAVTITLPYSYAREWQLSNYVFSHEEEEQSMVVLGIGMLFNHRNPEMIYHYWADEKPALANDSYWTPSTMMTPVVYETGSNVSAGEEVFITYGSDEWFEDRGIDMKNSKKYNADNSTSTATDDMEKEKEKEGEASTTTDNKESTIPSVENSDVKEEPPAPIMYDPSALAKDGYCVSDVFVAESGMHLTNFGLFAKRDFKTGEIVTISPLLSLPAEEVSSMKHESVLQNYCIATPDSKIALLPIGYGAIINHEGKPNLKMDWFIWNPPSDEAPANSTERIDLGASLLQKSLGHDVNFLLSAPFSTLDMKYTAKRDIQRGEELTIDYGLEWINAWANYLASSLAYHASDEKDEKTKAIFRHFIGPPAGLFPKHWNDVITNEDEEVDDGYEALEDNAKAAYEAAVYGEPNEEL